MADADGEIPHNRWALRFAAEAATSTNTETIKATTTTTKRKE